LEYSYKALLNGEAYPTEETMEPSPSQGEEFRVEERAAKWLVDRVNRARQSARFERALKAITDCQGDWAGERNLTDSLAAFACLAVSRNRGNRRSWEKVWAVQSGKTWKALKEFPDRISRMAKEIESVNASPFFSSVQIANAKTVKAEFARTRFNQLPGTMRVYAMALEAHIKRIPKLTETSFPRPAKGPSPWILLTSYTVRVLTGKWRDKLVAELLNSASLGLDEKSEFDGLTIAQARSRWKQNKS